MEGKRQSWLETYNVEVPSNIKDTGGFKLVIPEHNREGSSRVGMDVGWGCQGAWKGSKPHIK